MKINDRTVLKNLRQPNTAFALFVFLKLLFICYLQITAIPVLSALWQYAFTGHKPIFRHTKNRCILQTTPFSRHPSARRYMAF